MQLTQKKLNDIPYRFLSISFILWSNSSWSPIGNKAGFYCDDLSIREPYHGDSITAQLLFLVLLGGMALVIYISEFLVTYTWSDISCSLKSQYKQHMKYYYSGFLYVLAVTELLKHFFCELRPHFFYTCLPDMNNIKCSEGLIKHFNCTGSGPDWLIERDIYKSFPSGHASLSFYAFVFLCIYIESRTKDVPNSISSFLWKMGVSLLLLLWTITCCISRLVDHRHFWWDILVGIVIGLFGGIIMANVSLKYAPRERKIKSIPDNNNKTE